MILNISLINNSYYYKQVGFKANVKPKTDYSGLYEKMQKLEIKAIEEQEIILPAKNAKKRVKEKVAKSKGALNSDALQSYIPKEGTINGIFNGNVKIGKNKTLEIRGVIFGNIQIERDAKLTNYGCVNGDINSKGTFVNYGTVRRYVNNNGNLVNYGIVKSAGNA